MCETSSSLLRSVPTKSFHSQLWRKLLCTVILLPVNSRILQPSNELKTPLSRSLLQRKRLLSSVHTVDLPILVQIDLVQISWDARDIFAGTIQHWQVWCPLSSNESSVLFLTCTQKTVTSYIYGLSWLDEQTDPIIGVGVLALQHMIQTTLSNPLRQCREVA